MRLRRSLATLSFLALALAAAAPARDSDCPDQQATNVEARVVSSGHKRTCGIGFVVFGVGGGIWGDDCWQFEYLYPAHQECAGARLPDHFCRPDGDQEVKMRTCSCGGAVLPWVQIGVPTTCECDDWVSAGTIEDAQTSACSALR